jgi:hypothetical protein
MKLRKKTQLEKEKKLESIELTHQTYGLSHENVITHKKINYKNYKTQFSINLMLKNKIEIEKKNN